jgi:hypothetical protein
MRRKTPKRQETAKGEVNRTDLQMPSRRTAGNIGEDWEGAPLCGEERRLRRVFCGREHEWPMMIKVRSQRAGNLAKHVYL